VLWGASVFVSDSSSAAQTPSPYNSPKTETAIIEYFISVSYLLLDIVISLLAIKQMLPIDPDSTFSCIPATGSGTPDDISTAATWKSARLPATPTANPKNHTAAWGALKRLS
jgi:hypothetical protein